MKIEIWSDIACPFCYIGKRHLEKALEQASVLPQNLLVEWKSFELNPGYHNETGENTFEYLSREKGMPVTQAKQLTVQVQEMAKNAGLAFDFEKVIPANTRNGHRLLHYAKNQGKQDEMEESLFSAHFKEGLDIADPEVLLSRGRELGLDEAELEKVINGEAYDSAVDQDVYESRQIGVRGVPFFVFDRKYALSGAQPVEAFVQTLEKSYEEWKESHKTSLFSMNQEEAPSCDGDQCEL